MPSLLDAIRKRLKAEEEAFSLATGRGKFGSDDELHQRVGISKGLARALDLVNETAQTISKEEKEL